jgi:hypothetical protein
VRPLDRSFGIEGQPGRAAHGDADLGGQQLGAARHPQAHDLACPDAAGQERGADGAGAAFQLRIGEVAARPRERELVGMGACRGGENLSQHLVAQQISARPAAQHGGSQLVEHHAFGKHAPIHRVHRRPFRHGAPQRTRLHLLRNPIRHGR